MSALPCSLLWLISILSSNRWNRVTGPLRHWVTSGQPDRPLTSQRFTLTWFVWLPTDALTTRFHRCRLILQMRHMYLPPEHVAALLLPFWVPFVTPLSLALITGISRHFRKAKLKQKHE
jgi:hypothetical protein